MPETTAVSYSSHSSGSHSAGPQTSGSQKQPPPRAERDPDDDLRRFSVLIGAKCPRCGRPMVLAGVAARPRLMCQQAFGYGSLCCYSYSNVQTAEDELRPH